MAKLRLLHQGMLEAQLERLEGKFQVYAVHVAKICGDFFALPTAQFALAAAIVPAAAALFSIICNKG